MREVSEDEFEKVTTLLSGLPAPTDPSKRDKSWRSADELVREIPGLLPSWTGRELDGALRARFEARRKCPIRPAKYPGENTCTRLWGHVKCVGKGPRREKLQAQLSMKPRPLEPLALREDAPIVFLSHALEDHHFACRVRLKFKAGAAANFSQRRCARLYGLTGRSE
jgi:hypothetical protein